MRKKDRKIKKAKKRGYEQMKKRVNRSDFGLKTAHQINLAWYQIKLEEALKKEATNSTT